MSFGNSKECNCNECNDVFLHAKKLSEHIKKIHKLSSIDYVIKYTYNGERPSCLYCGNETRFVSLTKGFKKYCFNDRKIAESVAGQLGGKNKKSWNKGLTKETDNRIKTLSLTQTGLGNSFFGKHHSKETLKQNADAHRLPFNVVIERIKALFINVDVISTISDYSSQNDLLQIRCKICQTSSSTSFFNLQRCWRCKICFPNASRQQLEVVNYVKSLISDEVIISTRNIIQPYELDIWIPAKKVAIEYHGLYWHSGGKNGTFDKKRHREKYLACKTKEIRLIQIFSDEWGNRNDICKSIIRNALGANTIKINARDCIVELVTSKETKPFLDRCHINGSTNASYHYILRHFNYGIVAAATIRRPIQKRWGSNLLELARMAFEQGFTIRGGASKLLSKICTDISLISNGVLSYAELRFGEGRVYEQCGFIRVGESPINYWYTNGVSRFDRFKYRAQLGKPERQVAEEACVKQVYGCGNAIYVRTFN